MTTFVGKSWSFGLLFMSFVKAYECMYILPSLWVFEGGMWDLIVL